MDCETVSINCNSRMSQDASTPILASVIIPMLNEERHIGQCLKAVADNDLDASRYEVIVVDGGSTDRCVEIATEAGKRLPNFRIVANPQRVIPVAMNIGIQQARGSYIIRLDAHSECAPDYLTQCIEELDNMRAWNVGGTWQVRAGADSYISRTLALLVQHPFGVGNAKYRLGESGFVDTVPYGAFPKEVFDRVGLYREDLPVHEDYELNARIRKHGGQIYLSSRLSSVYHHPASLGAALRKAWRYGFWDAVSWKKYPYCFAWRHALPFFFVLATLIFAALSPWFPIARNAALALLLGYAVVAIAASFHVARRNGWRYLPMLPVLFMLRHVVFGVASLLGMLVPAKRSR